MKLFFYSFFLCLAQPLIGSTIIHEQQSEYSHIKILEKDHIRCLEFDSSQVSQKFYQGCMSTKNHEMIFNYTKALMGSLLLKKDPKRVLVLGLGAGIVPKSIYFLHPKAHFDIVDIDKVVVNIAHYFFGFPKAHNINITIDDARMFVKNAVESGLEYDIIIVDAFNGEYIPEHLMTQEFLLLVQQLLSDDGVMASNTFTQSALYDHESATYASVFGDFYNIQLDGDTTNRVILAHKTGAFLDVAQVHANAKAYYSVFKEMFNVDVNALLPKMEMIPNWDISARILTDQYSPVNALKSGQRVHFSYARRLDKIIRESPVIFTVTLGLSIALLFIAIYSCCRFLQTLRKSAL